MIEEGQRAVIGDKMVRKERLGSPETLGEQSPEAWPLTSERVQAKPSIGRFGFSVAGFSTVASIPIQSRTGRDLPERDAGLHHAERPRIHAEEDDRRRPAP